MAEPHGHGHGSAEVAGAELAPELTRYLPYLMRRAFAHVAAGADRSTQARDYAVLAALAAGHGTSQQALAERLEINRTIMVKLIDRLQGAGYVTRTRNPDNRRSYLLALTDSGRGELARMQPAVLQRDRMLTANLTAAERVRLNELLRTVLGEPAGAPSGLSTEYLITQVFYLLRRRGDALVSDAGLRVRDFGALSGIGKLGPCPQQQFARYLALTEPAAALIVDELVEKGLVTRGQDPDDRRRYALELTGLGRERLAYLTGAVDHMQAEIVRALGGEQAEAELHALIHKMLAAPVPAGADRTG
ncbi:MarR family winged helix-turn-helix transcriptional regulator [Streptomyces sp. NRRL F-5123]|uniref:MarR family winged helix-turn-helix transcriptional regulator n=1 Tax=Streptomyces sp. NRRL F-5123 TaxID=1463856 RepID=UPI0006937AFC|nr:MarR family transcriptional regulator [Streptomyces sp. NRRL F-5123]